MAGLMWCGSKALPDCRIILLSGLRFARSRRYRKHLRRTLGTSAFRLSMKTQDNSAPLSAHRNSAVVKRRRVRRRAIGSDSSDGFWTESHPQTTILLNALGALKNGDFAVRLPLEWSGVAGQLAGTFNEVATSNERTAQELAQLRQALGNPGVLLNAVTALKSGDFSVRLPLDWVGIAGKTVAGHSCNSSARTIQKFTDYCFNRQSDEGRSRKMSGSRLLGLSFKAGRHRTVAHGVAPLALSLNGFGDLRTSRLPENADDRDA
jgi:hypothetical protein